MNKNQFICSHLETESTIYYYRAPLNEYPRGRTIKVDHEEIELIIKGHVFLDFEGKKQKLSCGHIVWHVAGERTVTETDLTDPYECLVCRFKTVPGSQTRRPVKLSYWADSIACRSFVDEVLIASKQTTDSSILRDYAYSRLLWQVNLSINRSEQKLTPPIQRVIDRIHLEYQKPLTLSELCDTAEISESHLHLLFKRELGVSPHQYLLRRRMDEAKYLLEHSGMSIKEISYNCGFQGSASFCRSFRTYLKCTPLEFKQNCSTPRSH